MSPPDPARLLVPPGAVGLEVAIRAWETVQAGGVVELSTNPGPPPADVTGPALVLPTSGSTGAPHRVVLPLTALATSAELGSTHLGGPAGWLTAVPVTGVGGLLTVIRTLAAGERPRAIDSLGGATAFSAEGFLAAPEAARVSLVPTQLHRILRSPEATARLATFGVVLVGGAPLAPALRQRAEDAGVRVVATYGATETGGGVVYDGTPLPGVTVTLAEDGEILIGGPTVAAGYADDPGSPRFHGSVFHSGDLGHLTDGTLIVTGRKDDTIKVGGEKVSLARVTQHLLADPRVVDAAVVATDSDEWGQAPAAYVVAVPGAGPGLIDELGEAVAATLGPRARPLTMTLVPEIPTTSAGKPRRHA
ncbi:MAG: AMP-binding protein [Candidatus Nanopelagicales bacterium]